jgi:predicted transposase YdaD
MKKDLEESWVYQFILQEGREEGLQEGLQEGREEGLQEGLQEGREEERRQEVQRLRHMLTTYVEMRFPTVVPDARKHVETIQDPDVLQQVTLKIFAAQSEEQTLEILREAA